MSILSTYRRLFISIYLPTACFAVATQAAIVLLPLYILSQHGDSPAGLALASFVVGMRGLGMLLGDLPAGALTTRFGDKPVMLAGAAGVGLSCLLFASTSSAPVLIALTLLYGFSNAAWLLARLSFISDTCSLTEKGRVIALMAGIQRGGGLIGPALGGLVASLYGYQAALILIGCIGLLGTLPIIFGTRNVRSGEKPEGKHHHRLKKVIVEHWRIFATAGAGATALMALRGARQLVVPLYGHSLGLDPVQIGLVFSITSALDMAMFYPAGLVMDRLGRKWSAVPGTLVLAFGLALLPWVTGFWSLTAVGLLMAVANGLSTGVLMAMGSDYSPPTNRGEFLGVWRLVCDLGFAGGPLLVSLFVGLVGLASATWVVALLGAAGGAVMGMLAPETLLAHKQGDENQPG